MNAAKKWQRVAALALWYSLASTTGICSPEILAALIKAAPHGFGLSVSAAGTLLTVEMIANGAFSLAARLFQRYSSRSLIVCGFLATLLADIATTQATGLSVLIGLRAVAGAGLGVVTIAVSRFMAASEDPDRLSSLLLITSTVLSGSVLVAFGNSSPSATAVFASLACLAALGIATAALPNSVNTEAVAVRSSKQANSLPALAMLPPLFLIAATGLLNSADNGLYALTSVVGEHAGVGEAMLGYILMIAMAAGVVAAMGAGRLRTSSSRLHCLVGGILVKACVSLALVRMTNAGGFGAMVTLSSFTEFLAIPLLLGASAHLDRRGWVAAQVYGAIQIGGALGPAWASSLDELSGMRAVAIVCAVLLVVSAFLCLMPLRMVRELEHTARAT
jgi:predicted MFS family arabinose efflux permease